MKRILIVAAASAPRDSLQLAFAAAGFSVLQAEDGSGALKLLKLLERRNEELEMIITAIDIPDMDGLTLIKEMQKACFKTIPILVLAEADQEGKKMAGKAAGASGWLAKPFTPGQLLAVVSKFLKQIRRSTMRPS